MSTLQEIMEPFKNSHAVLVGLIEAWAYGEEEKCIGCGGRGNRGETPDLAGCAWCHGTGTIKTPNLVERMLQVAISERMGGMDEDNAWCGGLERELGASDV